MNNKPVKHFFALVRCLILAIPLITLCYHCFANLTHGWETIESSSGELVEHYDGFDTKSFNNACCYAWWDYNGSTLIDNEFSSTLSCHDFCNYMNEWGEHFYPLATIYESYGVYSNYFCFTSLDFFVFQNEVLPSYDNWGPYFFFNWYLNYLLSMSVLLFAIEIIFWFLDFVRNIMYKFGRKVD